MENSLTVHLHDKSIMNLAPSAELNMAQLLFLNGAFKGVPLCSGMGRCALCKVKFKKDARPPAKKNLRNSMHPK